MSEYFSLQKTKTLFSTAPPIVVKKNGKDVITMNYTEVKQYIDKFFIPLDTGDNFVKKGNIHELYCNDKLRNAFFNRLPQELSIYYFKEHEKVRRIISEISKPKLTDEEFNTFPGFKHPKKDYNSYSDEMKAKVNKWNEYIYKVLANERKDVDEGFKWYATVKGKKIHLLCI